MFYLKFKPKILIIFILLFLFFCKTLMAYESSYINKMQKSSYGKNEQTPNSANLQQMKQKMNQLNQQFSGQKSGSATGGSHWKRSQAQMQNIYKNFNVPGKMALPVTVKVDFSSKEQVANSLSGFEYGTNVYISNYFRYEDSCIGKGVLICKDDFSEFQLNVFGSPEDTRILQANGYEQWEENGSLRRNNYGIGPKGVRNPFSFGMYYPLEDQSEATNVNFNPTEIETSHEAYSTYAGEDLGSWAQTTGQRFIVTPQMMKQIVDSGRFEKTFKWQTKQPGNLPSYHDNRVRISMTVEKAPGILNVSPNEIFDSDGPDSEGNFNPLKKNYILKNSGKSPITIKIVGGDDWLNISRTSIPLKPNISSTVTLSISDKAKDLKEGTYKSEVHFKNITNDKGSTKREVILEVGEEQTWEVTLTGQETDDLGGKLMYVKMQDIWKNVTVNYGVRFDYKMKAQFVIKKQKGKWSYKKGQILEADVGISQNFDPNVFFVKSIILKNKSVVTNLKGSSLKGEVTADGKVATLSWPGVVPVAIATNKLKLETNSKEESHKGYSDNYFESNDFFHWTWTHKLPLKNGDIKFQQIKKSSKQRYSLDKRKPISLYYRYVVKKLK